MTLYTVDSQMEMISEFKKHNSTLKPSTNNIRQKNEDFESVRAKHIINQQNFMLRKGLLLISIKPKHKDLLTA